MKIRKFLVQIECSDRTKWTEGPAVVTELLAILATSAIASCTSGPKPAVTVIAEEIDGDTTREVSLTAIG